LLEEIVDLGARGRAHQTAKARAFDGCGRPSKAQRVTYVPCLHKPEREGTMKNITGAE